MNAPQRMCTACREMKEKRQLLRVVRTPSGELALDRGGKMSGRGAYICRDAACFNKARKTRSLEKALKTKITDQIWEALAAELEHE
mgnify:CR=1 FL=1